MLVFGENYWSICKVFRFWLGECIFGLVESNLFETVKVFPPTMPTGGYYIKVQSFYSQNCHYGQCPKWIPALWKDSVVRPWVIPLYLHCFKWNPALCGILKLFGQKLQIFPTVSEFFFSVDISPPSYNNNYCKLN